ncbi:lipocalin family protein [Aliiglaciecola sp. CAU 1673]|uniref:lipocalin family protein n=1 Tax=Aliiglaciecola sp. CAU 1673 TaxID=3032595 RepID=UPI0023DBC9A8|nr:lipocalin family protein [Aliiglaciecola sp. CAU 1673]MDF2176723.1 lipocalin family protein [Aliiglaciecola sp. CAU 1673]
MYRYLLVFLVFGLLSACTSPPKGVQPVTGFELNRYLGKWYEIARLDHSFERGLSHIQANYSLRDDGGVKVINLGWDTEKGQWREAEGKAYFVDDKDTGHLKVSFFGPFYGAYVILALDKVNYQYALVSGPDRDYLWILARTPQLEKAVVDQLLDAAKSAGFATENLIWVDHSVTKAVKES